jgi:hypothetical protein
VVLALCRPQLAECLALCRAAEGAVEARLGGGAGGGREGDLLPTLLLLGGQLAILLNDSPLQRCRRPDHHSPPQDGGAAGLDRDGGLAGTVQGPGAVQCRAVHGAGRRGLRLQWLRKVLPNHHEHAFKDTASNRTMIHTEMDVNNMIDILTRLQDRCVEIIGRDRKTFL